MLTFLIVKNLLFILKLIPEKIAYSLVDLLSGIVYLADKRHTRIARLNITRNLNTTNNIELIIRNVYSNFFKIPLDLEIFKRRVRKYNWRKWIEFDCEKFAQILNNQKGCILTTLHSGNWEIGGALLAILGYNMYVIAGTLKNIYLDNYLNNFRKHHGEEVIYKRGALHNLLAHQKSKKFIIGMLTDQNYGKRGINIEFIKDKAPTLKTSIILSRRWKIPIICGVAYRLNNFKFSLQFVIPDIKENDTVENALLKINRTFKKFVENKPEQWLWIHRRWNYNYR